MDAMHLPPGKTTEGRDEHYRCFECLYPVADDDGEFWAVAGYPFCRQKRDP
jgi:hypothetical protein